MTSLIVQDKNSKGSKLFIRQAILAVCITAALSIIEYIYLLRNNIELYSSPLTLFLPQLVIVMAVVVSAGTIRIIKRENKTTPVSVPERIGICMQLPALLIIISALLQLIGLTMPISLIIARTYISWLLAVVFLLIGIAALATKKKTGVMFILCCGAMICFEYAAGGGVGVVS